MNEPTANEVNGIIGIPTRLSVADARQCAAHAAELGSELARLGNEAAAARTLDLRCETCAFRPGTEANRTAKTILSASKCLEGRRTFFCHEGECTAEGFPLTPCRGYMGAKRIKFDEELAWEVASMA